VGREAISGRTALPHPDDLFGPRERFIATGDELDDAVYPERYNLSAAFFRFLPRPFSPARPEFLYLPMPRRARGTHRSGRSIVCTLSRLGEPWARE
jgi:hypothetical protein